MNLNSDSFFNNVYSWLLANFAQRLQLQLSGHLGRSPRCPLNKGFTVVWINIFTVPLQHKIHAQTMAFSKVLTAVWQIKIRRTWAVTRVTWVLCQPGIASLAELETECQHPVYQKIVVVLMLQVGWTVHTHQWRKALSLVEFVITGIPTVATGKTIFRSKTVALSMFTG